MSAYRSLRNNVKMIRGPGCRSPAAGALIASSCSLPPHMVLTSQSRGSSAVGAIRGFAEPSSIGSPPGSSSEGSSPRSFEASRRSSLAFSSRALSSARASISANLSVYLMTFGIRIVLSRLPQTKQNTFSWKEIQRIIKN